MPQNPFSDEPEDLFPELRGEDDSTPQSEEPEEIPVAPKPKKKAPPAVDTDKVQEILSDIRGYKRVLEVTAQNLQTSGKSVMHALSVISEIEGRLRTTRTTKRWDHKDSIELANQELTRLTTKVIPLLITELSSFVVNKLPATTLSFNEGLDEFLHPETKHK